MGIFNDNIHNPHSVNTGSIKGPVGPPGNGFKLTRDGNYNIDGKRLTNVGAPIDDEDATTKEYVDDELNSKVAKTQIMGGNAEAGKLVKYLPDKGMITPKMYIEDNFGDSVIIKSDDQDFDDVHLHIPNLKNYDGQSGRRKSNIMVNSIDNNMTGKIILPSGNLIMKDGEGSANQTVLNRADINKIYGSQSGQNGVISDKVALYSSDGTLFSNTFAIKNENDDDFVILRCRNSSGWRSLYIPSLGSNATIIIDQTNQTINGDKTFSKAITMTQEGSANNHLVTKAYVDGHSTNANYLKVDGSNMMTGDLNMNEQKVKNTLDPTDEQDTVNKRYLESQLTDYLKRDGQSPMTFDLNMNNFRILNVKDFNPATSSLQDVPNIKYIQDNFMSSSASILTGNLNAGNNRIFFLANPVSSTDAVNKSYVDNSFLKKDGSVPMTGNLNLDNHKIINLNEPTLNSDASTKKYVDDKTRINPSHSLTNNFKYLMDDINEISTEYGLIADKIDNLSWSPHQNKKVLYFKAVKDGLNYRYRLGFQMTQASPIANTIAIEQLFSNHDYWNKAEISINGTGIAIESFHTHKFNFSTYYYTKTIIQLKRLTAPAHQLYYTTHIDNVTSSPMQLQQYLLAYGVNSFISDVDSIVYNIPLYELVNGKMQMQVELDMNNKKIINFSLPTNVVNKNYLEKQLRINRTNIPITNGLSFALIPSLLSVDIGTNDKITIMKEEVQSIEFNQWHGNKKPLLKYNKSLNEYYVYFQENYLWAMNVNLSDLYGDTTHFFIVFRARGRIFYHTDDKLIFSVLRGGLFNVTAKDTSHLSSFLLKENELSLVELHISNNEFKIQKGNTIDTFSNNIRILNGLSNTIAIGPDTYSNDDSNKNVDLYEMLIYNKSLNDNEIIVIRKYLNNKYNLSS